MFEHFTELREILQEEFSKCPMSHYRVEFRAFLLLFDASVREIKKREMKRQNYEDVEKYYREVENGEEVKRGERIKKRLK